MSAREKLSLVAGILALAAVLTFATMAALAPGDGPVFLIGMICGSALAFCVVVVGYK